MSISLMKKGSSVLILPTDTVLSRLPHLVGEIGIVHSVPVHPTTWFKIQFSDGSMVTLRPSALKHIPNSASESVIAELVSDAKTKATCYTELPESNIEIKYDTRTPLEKILPNRTTQHTYNDYADDEKPSTKKHENLKKSHENNTSTPVDPQIFLEFMEKKRQLIQINDKRIISPSSKKSICEHPNFPSECMKEFLHTRCNQCYEEKWIGGKFCWNKQCVTSPIYWKLNNRSDPSASLIVSLDVSPIALNDITADGRKLNHSTSNVSLVANDPLVATAAAAVDPSMLESKRKERSYSEMSEKTTCCTDREDISRCNSVESLAATVHNTASNAHEFSTAKRFKLEASMCNDEENYSNFTTPARISPYEYAWKC